MLQARNGRTQAPMTQALNLAAFTKPTPAKAPDTDWQSLDVDTLDSTLQTAYFNYRKAQDHANTQRKAFETLMSAKVELPTHLSLAFGYKFGKLSVAIVPVKRPSSGRAALSLTDLMRRIP
jgi:hypothetical protein